MLQPGFEQRLSAGIETRGRKALKKAKKVCARSHKIA
jgi:hypothetical protein